MGTGSERQEWTYIDRSEYSFDPVDEPDVVQWRDEYTGLYCRMMRHQQFGSWCGYVGVEDSHPLSGLKATDEIMTPPGWTDQKSIDGTSAGIFDVLAFATSDRSTVSLSLFVDVHWGLTFSAETGRPFDFDGSWSRSSASTEEIEAARARHEQKPWECGVWTNADGSTEPLWWFGFDCGHCDDLMPGHPRALSVGKFYRDQAYVEGQVTSLAAQLKRLTEMLGDESIKKAPELSGPEAEVQ